MLLEKRLELMNYRMEMAKERLDSAHILLEHHNFKDSIGRSYYAMFTAVRAILALNTSKPVYLRSDTPSI